MKTLMDARKFSACLCASSFRQEPFAELIGCSDRQVRKWMVKNTDVHISTLWPISQSLGVPIEKLLSHFPDEKE